MMNLRSRANDAIGGTEGDARPRSEMFHLQGNHGKLLAVYTPAVEPREAPANLVVVPAFSEEMNRTRRMLSLLARRLATMGVGTLVIDLFGTGDSEGDFADASWEIWKDDIATAVNWVGERGGRETSLLGVRLGALLALDCARDQAVIERFILWQPTTSGGKHMRDFLFIRVLAGMMQKEMARLSLEDLRAALARGESVEISGYELSPRLFTAIDALRIEELAGELRQPVHWMEVRRDSDSGMQPKSLETIERWRGQGGDVHPYLVAGHEFWVDGKVKVVHDLIEETAGILRNAGR